VAGVVDPLAGSYYVESLTDRIERDAVSLIDRIDEYGGAAAAIEAGFQQREIEDAAYAYARAVESDDVVIVGVNRFEAGDGPGSAATAASASTGGEWGSTIAVLKVDPATEADQIRGLEQHRARRDSEAVHAALNRVRAAAGGDENVLYPMREALRVGATLGEVSGTLEEVFGRYRPGGR